MQNVDALKVTPDEVNQLEQALDGPAVASEPLAAVLRQARETRSQP